MRVQVLTQDWIEMKRIAIQRLQKAQAENLCLACMCSLEGEKRVVRGLHYRCYTATMRAIAARKWTEKDRIADAKLLPGEPGGRKPSNPVSIEASNS